MHIVHVHSVLHDQEQILKGKKKPAMNLIPAHLTYFDGQGRGFLSGFY